MISKERLSRHLDERGFVFEPIGADQLIRQNNVHVVVSRPGAVRGNHYHRKGTEILVVCGPALVRIRVDGELKDFSIAPDETSRLVIPPGVSHAVQHTGARDGILIAFNSERHEEGHPDVVRDVLLSPL